MPQQAYVRTKPHVNVGTLGHHRHGKTTLTAAVTDVLGRRGTARGVPVHRIDRAPEEAALGGSVHIAHVAYETDTRHYAHADLPGHPRFTGNVLTGAAGLDGAILVVSALDGVMPQTAEHLLLARHAGIGHVVVALTRADAGHPDITGLVETDVRRLLTAHGYDGHRTPVVRVSALGALRGDPRWTASVEALLDAVDTYIPTPVRYTEAPFLLPVERVLTVPRRGTAVTGVVERGTVRLRDLLELPAGFGLTHVTGLETFGRTMEVAEAGDRVALLLRGVQAQQVRRGDALAAPGSVTPQRHFTARARLLTAAEGGRRTPVRTGFRAQFHLRTADATGEVDLGLHGTAGPGRTVALRVALDRPLPLRPGLPFAIREGRRTVGVGTVSGVPGGAAREIGTIEGWTNPYP
ncbi:elongation factor Tu [Streptomyces cinnamoneus]|uniref:Elongation factor Tu n=1 Tax=Streptomyces cinnamoneus TaxID=53446 RepID=A0A918WDG7_STRCJ|nr:elongation factor Tu [Streptomyces cinnamoneus]GHC33524.1 elongation factor Tu-3 [Streptomyces cinnamoneus]